MKRGVDDMRQNERGVEFVRARDAVSTWAGARESQCLSWASSQFL